MLHGPRPTQQRARTLRETMTLPEVLLWRELRKRPGGLKFRRQHPAGAYVLDFFCASARVAVEIDGEGHERGDRPARDVARDGRLKAQGVRACRIPAVEVLRDVEAVVRHLVAVCGDEGDYPSTAFGGPPPPSGED